MKRLSNHLFITIFFLSLISYSCEKLDPPSISEPIPPTCSDGIQNQGETEVDCGGPCAPCSRALIPILTAVIGGSSYEANAISAFYEDDTLNIMGQISGQNTNLLVKVFTNFEKDTVIIEEGRSTFSGSLGGRTLQLNSLEGMLIFTVKNQTEQFLSGTFNFSALDQNQDTVQVTDGVFEEIKYIE